MMKTSFFLVVELVERYGKGGILVPIKTKFIAEVSENTTDAMQRLQRLYYSETERQSTSIFGVQHPEGKRPTEEAILKKKLTQIPFQYRFK